LDCCFLLYQPVGTRR